MQILSPAGSFQALRAAVFAGADAVYLGASNFNARINADNFSPEEISSGISFCHERGVAVHAVVNTLVGDREMKSALETAGFFVRAGADALIVQDLGFAREIRKLSDIPLHASTQITAHSLDAVNFLADEGFSRVVLSRELSFRDISYITEHAPVETEIFVHGALCMCYSGQCYMSSVIGARSGNRGKCAQPCRLPYAGGYRLSLKDMCLLRYMKEIEKSGVSCVKIEGRMKSPGYVYAVTKEYADIMRSGEYSEDVERRLAEVFSRGGFTDGYFTGHKGENMFGVHTDSTEFPRVEEKEYKRLFLDIRIKGNAEHIDISAVTSDGFAAEDSVIPEKALSSPTSSDDVKKQFSRLGDTVYSLRDFVCDLPENVFLPAAKMNASRRRLLDCITAMRLVNNRSFGDITSVDIPCKGSSTDKTRTEGKFRDSAQIPQNAAELSFIWLPLTSVNSKAFRAVCDKFHEKTGVYLPTVVTDSEIHEIRLLLSTARDFGIKDVMCDNIGQISLCSSFGFRCHADSGFNVFNSFSRDLWKNHGLASCTLSFEMNIAQLKDCADGFCVAVGYGRLPFMITENCIKKEHGKTEMLKDRTGREFPVTCEFGCRNRIWNSDKLYMADKDMGTVGAVRLIFTDESPAECEKVVSEYVFSHSPMPEKGYTRGLYNKKV